MKNVKYHHINVVDKEIAEKNQALWDEIRDNGEFIKNEYTFDFLVTTYKYNDKYYELWFNDNHGYTDHIKEYELDETNNQ